MTTIWYSIEGYHYVVNDDEDASSPLESMGLNIINCWEEEEEATRSAACYLPSPMFPAADDLPPFPPTADDDVLMPDLEPFLQALGNELVVDNGAAPILPVAMDHPIETTTQQPLQINDRHDDDGSLSGGYDETAAAEQQRCAFARPPAVEKKKKKRGDGPAAGGRSLQHVGLDELRRYFYMPMTKAAQELNVGTTALKKRCRELGVARWPHRKMKSLRSLISNLQEMGNGMSLPPLEAVQEELEVCCAMMEQNPGIELSESTKKLRQACFKESYNRRR
ncbi:protein RKD4-like [Brachypodium distachyon]|uniref:protein RKD4-like n=1 Tax=Brachypodium distachyon TaxID=15368 RepID=UPI000D0E26DE|nr:protein RKD4-like [Brachypodium distachyon]|eukprot:XP_024314653.1 protein RKD4-like [Brachypodium distachyon]